MKSKNTTSMLTRDELIEHQISIERKTIAGTGKTFSSDYKPHWHDFFEIELILGGTGSQLLNGHEYPLTTGCVYMLTPQDFHHVTAESDIDMYNLMFCENMLSEDFIRMIFESGNGNILYLSPEELDEAAAICRLLESEYNRREKYRDKIIQNILECLLMLIMRKIRNPLPDTQSKMSHIQKAVFYMQQHFTENPTLTQTAAAVGLNKNYFSQRFRQETGSSYTEYLTELKISYAKKLMLSTNLSATEICFAAGFGSLSNFMKVFKAKTATSPARYAGD